MSTVEEVEVKALEIAYLKAWDDLRAATTEMEYEAAERHLLELQDVVHKQVLAHTK